VSVLLPSDERQAWRALGAFDLYRIFLAVVAIALGASQLGPEVLGRRLPEVFLWAASGYLAFAVLWAGLATRRRPRYRVHVYVGALIDIVAIVLLVRASGGVSSGLGMLLITTIGGAGLLAPGRVAVLLAALASIALLVDEALGQLYGSYVTTGYTQVGLLGATLLAAAGLATTLVHRARESEALAARRGVDLANLAELNEHIIERMQSGLIVVDDEGDIRLMNEAAWALLGDPQVDNPFRLPEVSPELWALVEDWRRAQDPGPRALNGPEGEPGDIQVRLTRLGAGEQLATLAFIEDTAEMQRRMQEVKLASLGRLTASIAHEIRNPLGAISHAAQLMGEAEGLETPERRMVQIIQDNAKRMNEVVRNVLRLSRREPPRLEQFALGDWLAHFAQEFTGHERIGAERLPVRVEPPDTVVAFDPGQLHQVLWNLCANALRYGASGADDRIELHAGLVGEGRLPCLDVIDHGPGISDEVVAQLFEPFFTTGATGTGLGLYIARELCEINGGRLEYLPLPTGGSCFRVHFPDPHRHPAAA
jgi:two-component system sensor histidine kinase PilS (NtrC family)